MDENNKVSGLPELTKSVIWMINFGYLGIQIAFTLETSQMSRIFQTLGADPTKLGWFFILPPLAGLVVQPAIGSFSDRTWAPKLGGRRLPYLLIGMIFAVIMMLFLPNIGSLGLGYGSIEALVFGAIAIAILDVAANMAMQPFKMMIGDMVNDEQKSYAYGIQSMLSNSGAVIAAFFPFLLTVLGVANTAKKGVVPQSVVISFYVGATILVITSLLTVTKVHEYDPKTYARYHGIKEEDNKEGGNWFGVLTAVQSIAAVIWSYVLAKVPNDHHKVGYGISLLLGAIGYGSIFFIHSQNILIVSFILIGISWAAMNTYPLTMVSNALSGKHMGTYLGLFNCSICLPQIIASLLSFILFPLMKYSMPAMMLTAGISGVLAAVCVLFIKETYKN
ncbi:SLC45 family MFS transporter [Lactobacillus johnsonii]|jgi:maltose/moltooligosaccharide transporter|uniref:SLC45 family MFS transporter n=1 Tax=Lactobacillus johnsonii TaxID=33959 RepID=UPI0011DDF63A|nr:SLC45 family MFS transporter [Lactobacillus johnsonii]